MPGWYDQITPQVLQQAGAGGIPTRPPMGPVIPGNLDPWRRPILNNPDGSISTTRSMSFGTDKGETLVPTVVDDHNLMQFVRKNPYQQAMDHYNQTGQSFGSFGTPMAADAYAQYLHETQAKMLQILGLLNTGQK